MAGYEIISYLSSAGDSCMMGLQLPRVLRVSWPQITSPGTEQRLCCRRKMRRRLNSNALQTQTVQRLRRAIKIRSSPQLIYTVSKQTPENIISYYLWLFVSICFITESNINLAVLFLNVRRSSQRLLVITSPSFNPFMLHNALPHCFCAEAHY